MTRENPSRWGISPHVPTSKPVVESNQLVRRRHTLFGLAVAVMLFGVVAGAFYTDPDRSVYPLVLFVCGMAGIAAALAAAGIGAANDEIRSKGDCFRAAEEIVLRNRDFLFDNPVVSANDQVRRALLPSDKELVALGFSTSMATMLREFREGEHWFMQGGHRSGPRYCLAHPRTGGTSNAVRSTVTPEVKQ